MKHSDFDLIEAIANCYQLEENLLEMQIHYHKSKRKTNLQGPTKLACRALVMKQYKTTLNHLLQINEEWYFEHGDRFKLYSILCKLCTSHNIALEVTEIIKEKECEEIQTIVFTASRLQSKIDINSPEMLECIKNIKSSAF
ncbi:Hypothetical predicted protein [Mytilus galloprovincialis]|uniref:Uncharacterized protein n=1 Tax=Mytilus galloprovincialis TaxID=29158 RepID=A0A8B6E3S8_MYTGA|nr:Hypothetical predicted protein [Mytilus galloprovincialis]